MVTVLNHAIINDYVGLTAISGRDDLVLRRCSLDYSSKGTFGN